MIHDIQTRWQAFGIHLLICLIIFVVVAAIILFDWYPDYFRHFGGLFGLGLIAGIDLILGPTLTLIVFNRNKKHLKWDLAAIGLLQLSALSYGIWAVYQGRPMAQVLTHEGIHILTKSDLDSYKIASSELKISFNKFPIKVYLDLPNDLNQIKQISTITEFTEQRPLASRIDLYRNFSFETDPATKSLLKIGGFQIGEKCTELPIFSRNTQYSSGCLAIETGELSKLK